LHQKALEITEAWKKEKGKRVFEPLRFGGEAYTMRLPPELKGKGVPVRRTGRVRFFWEARCVEFATRELEIKAVRSEGKLLWAQNKRLLIRYKRWKMTSQETPSRRGVLNSM